MFFTFSKDEYLNQFQKIAFRLQLNATDYLNNRVAEYPNAIKHTYDYFGGGFYKRSYQIIPPMK